MLSVGDFNLDLSPCYKLIIQIIPAVPSTQALIQGLVLKDI